MNIYCVVASCLYYECLMISHVHKYSFNLLQVLPASSLAYIATCLLSGFDGHT